MSFEELLVQAQRQNDFNIIHEAVCVAQINKHLRVIPMLPPR